MLQYFAKRHLRSAHIFAFAVRQNFGAGAIVGKVFFCTNMSSELRSFEIVKREDVAETPWIKLSQVTYKLSPDAKERKWDVASRNTKHEKKGADAVTILALLHHGGKKNNINNNNHLEKEVLLVTQFRPPLGKLSIELPAGLIDEGETAGQAAVRELKEETGFVGRVVNVSPILSQSPGMTDETTQVAVVDVDLSSEENQNPVQRLEDTEKIEVERVKLSEYVQRLGNYEQDVLTKGLYYLALGIQIASGAEF